MAMKHWPDIPFERWQSTGASLHMWSQIAGKFRLAQTPWLNHSWHATFYVTASGLTSSLIPGNEHSFEISFDFIDHQLVINCTDGGRATIALQPMSVAEFYGRFTDALTQVGAPTGHMHGLPNEVPNPVPFAQQTTPGDYNPEAAHDFWQALVAIDGVFKHFRTGYLGKASPVHLFWGSFDLAVTRFSGRTAPRHPGGIPALPDHITREAYSHEVSSAGFWPGGGPVNYPAFYSYAYPTPAGFAEAPAMPAEAYWHQDLGEFLLPYDAVRQAENPAQTLLDFLQSTYDAAANLGEWERKELDCALGQINIPRIA